MVQRPLDPTAMTLAHSNKRGWWRRIPLRINLTIICHLRIIGSTVPNSGGTGVPSRRIDIFNASDMFSPDEGKQLTVYPKPEGSKKFLTTALSSHYLFESLDDDDMNKIVDCMKPSFASVDEVIIRQGDIGDLFFCLEIGNAYAQVDGREVFVYEPGGCFGELALIYNSPRAASVIARSACKLWAVDLK